MKEEISFFASEPSKCGLEVFVRTKTEPLMKKMALQTIGICITHGGQAGSASTATGVL